MRLAVDLSVAAHMRVANVVFAGRRTLGTLRALAALVAFTLGPATGWTDPAADAQGHFMASAKAAAAKIRALPEYAHPHCDFDALIVGNGIVRVAQASMTPLKPDDLVIAVNGARVDPKDPHGVWTLLKTHAPNEVVTLSISRDGTDRKARVSCQSSNDDVAPRLAALDSAAAGDFKDCAIILRGTNRRLLQAANYGLLTNCELRSGELSPQDASWRRVQYWALLFQELARYSDQIESLRAQVLLGVQYLEQSGQNRLAAELDSMFAKATGSPLSSTPVASNPTPPAVNCEQLADTNYSPIPDNSAELLRSARDRLAQNAAAEENLAAARQMTQAGQSGWGDLMVNAASAAADKKREIQDQLLQYDLEINRQQQIELKSQHDAFVANCRASGKGY